MFYVLRKWPLSPESEPAVTVQETVPCRKIDSKPISYGYVGEFDGYYVTVHSCYYFESEALFKGARVLNDMLDIVLDGG